ncbi:MAG: hypothetical protein AAGI38_22930 [Bacteroidota bacterium]
MNTQLLLLLCLLLSQSLYAQQWKWVQTAGSEAFQNSATAICTTPDQAVAITGFHRRSIRFFRKPHQGATLDLVNFQRKDNRMFVAKYTAAGELEWANDAQGYFAEGCDVAATSGGVLLVAGHFAGQTTFHSTDGNHRRLNGGHPGMAFLAAYDGRGSIKWIVKSGYPGASAQAERVYVSGQHIYVVGHAVSQIGQSMTFTSANGTSERYSPLHPGTGQQPRTGFIGIYSLEGELETVRFLGGNQAEVWPTSFCMDRNGGMYLGGKFAGKWVVQGHLLETNGFQQQGFILSLDAKGNYQWSCKIQGDFHKNPGPRVAISKTGLLAAYANRESVGIVQGKEVSTQEVGNHLGILAFNHHGKLRRHLCWPQRKAAISVGNLVESNSGTIYLAGGFAGNVQFADNHYTSSGFQQAIQPNGLNRNWLDYHAMVMAINPVGKVQWLVHSQGNSAEMANDVCLHPTGKLHIVGHSGDDPHTSLGQLSLRLLGETNAFVACLDPSKAPLPALKVPKVLEPEKRKLVDTQILEVTGARVELRIWDHNEIDGDVIKLTYGDEVLLNSYRLGGIPKSFWIERPISREAQIVVHAVNTGRIYPNTAAILVIDSKNRQRAFVASDLLRSEVLTLKWMD